MPAEDEGDRERRQPPGIDLAREANVPEAGAEGHEEGVRAEQEIDGAVDGGEDAVGIEEGVREYGPISIDEAGKGGGGEKKGEGEGRTEGGERRPGEKKY